MKIFYAVQATGNGHIARAMELMPYLQQHGEVDIFLSGSNNSLNTDLPIKFRSKGMSLFYGNKGGLDYWKIAKAFNPVRILKEARDLPVEQYDVVLNDFESITSLSCKMKHVTFVHFGHQASFASDKTPMPYKKDWLGEFILKNYASSPNKIGLHFESYDQDIYNPIIKKAILDAEPSNQGHVTVYLSHYSDEVVVDNLLKVRDIKFHLFSKKIKQDTNVGNILLKPVSNDGFNKSMISSAGVITGAGFETPAEALYMNKRLMCLPILGQYEQLCNAAAIKQFNATVIDKIDDGFVSSVKDWIHAPQPKALKLDVTTAGIVQLAIDKALSLKNEEEQKFDLKELLNPSDIAFPLPTYSI